MARFISDLWGTLGAPLGDFGHPLGRFGHALGSLWGAIGGLWKPLGSFLDVFGRFFAPSRRDLGQKSLQSVNSLNPTIS